MKNQMIDVNMFQKYYKCVEAEIQYYSALELKLPDT